MLSPDTLLAGKYRILSVIGRGGYGQVYLGYDEAAERYVAIKELRPDELASADELRDYQARFRREAQVGDQLRDPHVAAVYALETDPDGAMYLVMEHVNGGSLKQLLSDHGPLPPEVVLDIGIGISRAIEALYAHDIVHRDIKPSNILLAREGTAKLTDLGIAQVGQETRRTQLAGPHPGTPVYMSPEQATSAGYLDQRSDLYALGLVLYEALTGRLYVRHRVSPADQDEQVPPALNAVVMKALEEDPAKRYPTAEAMRRDLEQVRDQTVWGQVRIVLGRVPTRRVVVGAGLAALLVFTLSVYRLGTVRARLPLEAVPIATAVSVLETQSAAQAAGLPGPTPAAVSTSVPQPGPAPAADLYEPDEEAPARIAVGETQERAFEREGDVDRLVFEVEEGFAYVVTTANLAVGMDTRLEVLVGSERYINDDIAPGLLASQVTFTAAEDGVALVEVYNTDQFGPSRTYDISVLMTLPAETPDWLEEPTPTEESDDLWPPTPTPRPTLIRDAPTATQRPTSTPRPTSTQRPTYTRTPTRTPTLTRTATPTRTPTLTRTPTNTPQPTPVPPTATPVPPTDTPRPPTDTPRPTEPPTPERTPLPVRPTGPPVR